MPRKKIPFKTVPGSQIRYIDDFGLPLFVATDIARALGYPPDKAGTTASAWKAQMVQLLPGHKEWRMMTLDEVRAACWRSRSRSGLADEFREWFEHSLRWMGYTVERASAALHPSRTP